MENSRQYLLLRTDILQKIVAGAAEYNLRTFYRQHNSPQCFQDYFEETLERLPASNKSVFIMGQAVQHKPTRCRKMQLCA